MTLHVLHAGDGYTYLTRQVAVSDQTLGAGESLASYYTASGEPPGHWAGSGTAGLGVDGVVSGAQMRALFGEGLHPEADRLVQEAISAGGDPEQAIAATRLGRRFAAFKNDSPFKSEYAAALATFREDHQRGANDDERRVIRRELATAALRERDPQSMPTERDIGRFLANEQRRERQPVAGVDLVFTPVKSIVVLWAVGDHDTRAAIEAAHETAWRSVLSYIEKEAAFTRIGAGGVAQIDTRGLVATAFDHRTSRTGDPDLHTHLAVANKVQGVDGKWRSLDARVLHSAAVNASEMYNARVENEVRDRLGVSFIDVERADGKRPVREIDGVLTALTRAFSQRRQAIEVRYDELVRAFRDSHSRDPSTTVQIELAQQATLDTREGKPPAKSLADIVAEARETARTVGIIDPETAVLSAAQDAARGASTDQRSDRQVASDVLDVVSGARSTWNRWNVRSEIERQARGRETTDRDALVDRIETMVLGGQQSVRITPDDSQPAPPELSRDSGESQFRVHGQERFTSHEVLAAEARLMEAAETDSPIGVDVSEGFGAAVVDYWCSDLDRGQRALAEHFVDSRRLLAVGVGPAGAGKTRSMAAMARAWESGGGRVVGLAPSAVAARVLSEDLGAPAETLSMMLAQHRYGRLDADVVRPGDLLLVDEASMASTRQLDAVLDLARERDAVVRLIGDPEQLGAVDAGGSLGMLMNRVGGVTLTELHRFGDPLEAHATLGIRAGDPAAIEFYSGRDRIHEGSRDQAIDHAYADWRADRAIGLRSLLVAKSNDTVAALNARARADLVAVGAVEASGATLRGDVTAGVGDTVVTRTVDRTIAAGAKGDFVRNGDLWRITAIGEDASLSVQRVDGSLTAVIPAAYAAASVDLGYATTAHRSQGMTVDRSRTITEPGMSRQELYVAASRGRQENHLYAVVEDDLDLDLHHQPDQRSDAETVLARVIATDGNERSATETIETEQDAAVTLDRTVPEYLHALDLTRPAELDGPTPWLPAPAAGTSGLDQWTVERAAEIRERVADLGTRAEAERPEWVRGIDAMASPDRTETVALVAAYREQFQVDGPEPLGADTAGSQVQQDAAAHLAERLAALTPAAEPAGLVETVELYRQVVETETDVRRLTDQHRTNDELIEQLRTHPSAVEAQRRQQELGTRAQQIHTFRTAAAQMAALRQTTSGRVQQIAETELRIAEGGRRAARRDGEQLADLRRLQDAERAAMQQAAQTMGGLHQVVGSAADQDAVLAEQQRNVEHGPQIIAAAAARDDVQLGRRMELAGNFEERIAAAQDRLAVDRTELAVRPEDERVAAEQEIEGDATPDVAWQSRAPETPQVDYDIER